jgi:hypothetical protein
VKILLDECLPLDFRHSFPEHDVHTFRWAGFKGKKNEMSIIIVAAPTNQLEDLLPLANQIVEALETLKRGAVIRVPESE